MKLPLSYRLGWLIAAALFSSLVWIAAIVGAAAFLSPPIDQQSTASTK
jgi:hypothetical protein